MNVYERRVVIVEDTPELKELYAFMINGINRYQVVASYESCEQAVTNLRKDKPDIIFMDIELPGMSGIEGIGTIKKQYPNVEIIVLTILENDDVVFNALSAGADAYLSKTAGITEIEKALEQLEKGGSYMSSRIARKVVESFQKSHFSPLTRRETEVLTLIASGKTYVMIASELNIAKDTVKSHIKNIYAKLQVETKADAISLAQREKFI